MIRKLVCATAFVFAASISTVTFAQHSDIIYGYDDNSNPGAIILENDNTTSDGIQYWESAFEDADPGTAGDQLQADEPGFANEPGEGFIFNTGDEIFVAAVDASMYSSFGVGFVNYYNPGSGMLEASGDITIFDDVGSTSNHVLSGATATGDALQFLGTADADGEVHEHVTFDIDDSAAVGAYGVLLRVYSDLDIPDGTLDVESDEFWIIFNNGLTEEEFEDWALPQFGVVTSVPEPGSLGFIVAGSLYAISRRRRRV